MSRIVRIPILPFKISNAHLLLGSKGAVLIDAGLPGTVPKIEKALSKNGLSFKDLTAIVITHAHVDHAGGAAELRERSRAPLIAHEDDLPYYKRERPMTFCPTGWAGRVFFRTPLPHEPYTAFEPDILLSNNDTLDLSPYGVTGTVKHTPGHTKGSVSVELEHNQAMVGDLLASGIFIGGLIRTGHAIRPPFEDDPRAVSRELLRLIDAGFDRFHVGHGGALDYREVRRHAEALARTSAVR
ncbi:Glyoxylase, beta-lactamase superfamily II [Bryocella elongata]|uniref:Glyoxylase, beta-lactamase superfamily II n=1 Tax=Bryocella elongata TaxID=863522 RepID=A0A1H5WUL6_9BACT|nr:MBL fold metallo-hydrolase [Bryocella elongata]SEG03192.1 Glyoxylase, beta-lactamase superfamily II [Bryocella elongata]